MSLGDGRIAHAYHTGVDRVAAENQGTPGCGVASLTLSASPTGFASVNEGVGCAATQHLQSSTDRPEDSTKQ